MAGAIIENMSTKKLCIVGGILLVFQIIAFLVGGLIGKCQSCKLSPFLSFRAPSLFASRATCYSIAVLLL